ncbi:maternal B9.10 protein-like [Ornithodoros turicata]|uniref:Putative anti-proliferation factor btg1/tob n=1 Tax=Ornithodoros turicata TaxID=34597 RepID=A0A2R5LIN8_9ACAR
MQEEIEAAVAFLARVVRHNSALTEEQLEALQEKLRQILGNRFRDHWFPEKPSRGQAYRCIRINENEPREPVLEQAAWQCGLAYDELCLPVELTVWVDPQEVCCRYGERRSSYCILASFKNGNSENYVEQFNLEELEQQSGKRSKQTSLDLINSKRRMGTPRGCRSMGLLHLGSSIMHSSARGSPNFGLSTPQPPSPTHLGGKAPRAPQSGDTFWNLGATQGQKPDKYHWVNKALVKA